MADGSASGQLLGGITQGLEPRRIMEPGVIFLEIMLTRIPMRMVPWMVCLNCGSSIFSFSSHPFIGASAHPRYFAFAGFVTMPSN